MACGGFPICSGCKYTLDHHKNTVRHKLVVCLLVLCWKYEASWKLISRVSQIILQQHACSKC